jgi:hypothetical protein
MSAMTARLSLIRFITARQSGLRGLREVVIAASVCLVMMFIIWPALMPKPFGMLAVVFLWIFALEVLLRLVDWRYDATYGRVARTWFNLGRTTRCQTLLAIGAALDMFAWFPLAGQSAFPLVVAAHALWIVARDFPWRGYYLAAVLVAFIAPPVDDPSRMISYFPAYAAGLATIAFAGLLDHILLMTAFAQLKTTGQTIDTARRA